MHMYIEHIYQTKLVSLKILKFGQVIDRLMSKLRPPISKRKYPDAQETKFYQ